VLDVPFRLMALYPRIFMRLIDGRAGGIAEVAYLPSEVGVLFSASTSSVQIERACAIKLLITHKLTYYDLNYIQSAINEGYIIRGRELKFLEFVFIDSRGPYRHYLLVLKTAMYGQEVWVQTFHRSDEYLLRAKLKAGRMIRQHL
jgi:hypothetical protein